MSAKINVVVGGAGFIGSHLCRALLAAGDIVFCVDNLSTGSLERISDLYRTERFHFILRDANEALDVPSPVDAIYNLAARPTLERAAQFPALMETAVSGSHSVIELARQEGARLVFASSSVVYGEPGAALQSEDDAGAVDCFSLAGAVSEAARVAEAIHYTVGVLAGVDVRVARVFGTYGPDTALGEGCTVSTMLLQAMSGQELVVTGDGAEPCSLCFVSDVVAGLRALMDAPMPPPRPVNLGNPDPTRLVDVAALIQSEVGGRSAIVHGFDGPNPSVGPLPDISRARELLGWQPEVSIREGIHLMVEYFPTAFTQLPRTII